MRAATLDHARRSGQQVMEDWKARGEGLAEAVEEGRAAVECFFDEARERIEDLVYQTTRRVRRNPMTAVAVAFGAGALLGAALFGRSGRR